MIKEGLKLPPLVTDRTPGIIEEASKDSEVVAFFSFGSLAKDALKMNSTALFLEGSVTMDDRVRNERRPS
jgi:uncharacterized protein YigE (DUF2233 family)